MNKMILTMIAGASAMGLSAAMAGHHEEGEEMTLDQKVEAKFVEVDVNADGAISGEENLAYFTAEAAKKAAESGEEVMSEEDIKAKADKSFAAMAGEDAMASLDEVKAYAHARQAAAEAEAAKKAAMSDEAAEPEIATEGEGDADAPADAN